MISSFQNEAVDNAISTPLPGDIPAYRKLARRAKDSSQEQYQRALDEWYSKLCQAIENSVPNAAASEYVAQKICLMMSLSRLRMRENLLIRLRHW